MKSMLVPLLLLGGVPLCGAALAAEPATAPQPVAAQGEAMKVAIDPVTGKRRQITQAESRALDAQAAAHQRAMVMRMGKSRKPGVHMASSRAESLATAKTINGITAVRFATDDLSSLSATIDANGKVTITEGAPSAAAAQELPSE